MTHFVEPAPAEPSHVPNMLDELQAELNQRAAQGLLRHRRVLESAQGARVKVDGEHLISFCSNDYLGLASHPDLVSAMKSAADQVGVGTGASHLVTGHQLMHDRLEQQLASLMKLPAVLLFTTGYMANLGIITALVGRGDAVFADKLNHASLNDAAVLSRADLHRYPHNDLAALESLLAKSTAKRKLVIADSVFSMDGDIAPVPALLALCEQYDAYLMLDDAHGFGVLGENGRGVLEHFHLCSERVIYMATLGKAAGAAGAFVAGEQVLVDYLLQTSRPYIYTTASPAPVAAAALAGIKLIETDSQRRQHLHALIKLLRDECRLQRWQLMPSDTAIQPIIVGGNEEALAASGRLLEAGILVPAIRPPTVPKGTARLRISLSAAHTVADVRHLIAVLQKAESA